MSSLQGPPGCHKSISAPRVCMASENLMRLSRLRVKEEPDDLSDLAGTRDSWSQLMKIVTTVFLNVSRQGKCFRCEFRRGVGSKGETRQIPDTIKVRPPPLSTGILFDQIEEALADLYGVAPTFFGTARVPSEQSPEWIDKCSARTGMPVIFVRMDQEIGWFPAAHAQGGSTWGVAVTSLPRTRESLWLFQCRKGTVRCLVLWRTWLKKHKVQTPENQGRRWDNGTHVGWHKTFHELWPNMALEKHDWLGGWPDLEGRMLVMDDPQEAPETWVCWASASIGQVRRGPTVSSFTDPGTQYWVPAPRDVPRPSRPHLTQSKLEPTPTSAHAEMKWAWRQAESATPLRHLVCQPKVPPLSHNPCCTMFWPVFACNFKWQSLLRNAPGGEGFRKGGDRGEWKKEKKGRATSGQVLWGLTNNRCCTPVRPKKKALLHLRAEERRGAPLSFGGALVGYRWESAKA